ncbi:MAG: hypothetical protein DI582_01360 [Azospirillum brasilense]|nr:MAG: hypothetical protein DI582_01360 [Azospirillum brasilense]
MMRRSPLPADFSPHDLVALARAAGDAILQELSNAETLGIERKSDDSPFTRADQRANDIVLAGLKRLTPDIPVLSEEDPPEHQQWVMQQPTYWCVDPLDGTRTAVQYSKGFTHYDGFGTLIGLVHHGVPVFGVAHYPNNRMTLDDGTPSAPGITYFTSADGALAYRQLGDQAAQPIHTRPCLTSTMRVAEGYGGQRLQALGGLAVQGSSEVGGSRLIRAAEASVHAGYTGGSKVASFGFWDVAAPHAILRAAGGELVTLPSDFAQHQQAGALKSGEALRYDGRHYAAAMGQGKPYVPLCVGAHTDTLRRLGLPVRQAGIER